jgi:hypothetical protein
MKSGLLPRVFIDFKRILGGIFLGGRVIRALTEAKSFDRGTRNSGAEALEEVAEKVWKTSARSVGAAGFWPG